MGFCLFISQNIFCLYGIVGYKAISPTDLGVLYGAMAFCIGLFEPLGSIAL